MSRHEFLVATSIGVLSSHFCCKINFLLLPTIATSKWCRGINGGFSYPCSCASCLNVCHDMNSWSRPRLESLTYIYIYIFFFFATSNCMVETLQVHSAFLPGCDIHYLLRPIMSSFCVATSKRCRDMILLEVPSILVSASFLPAQQLLLGLLLFLVVT